MTETKRGLLRRLVSLLRKRDTSRLTVADLPMERLVLKEDFAGHLGLELTELPNWRSFEGYAEILLRQFDGRVFSKATLPDMHLWDIEIDGVSLRLVYEDYPNRICLESDNEPGDRMIRELQKRLASPAAT